MKTTAYNRALHAKISLLFLEGKTSLISELLDIGWDLVESAHEAYEQLVLEYQHAVRLGPSPVSFTAIEKFRWRVVNSLIAESQRHD